MIRRIIREHAEIKVGNRYIGADVVASKHHYGHYTVTKDFIGGPYVGTIHKDTSQPRTREWVFEPNTGNRTYHPTLGSAVAAAATLTAQKAPR